MAGPDDGSLDPALGAELVAAAREALTNARKHARADTIVVYCESAEGAAMVSVRDDGVGFDPLTRRRRVGLRESIAARLARCGGTAEIESAPGAGTHVTLRVGVAGEPPAWRLAG